MRRKIFLPSRVKPFSESSGFSYFKVCSLFFSFFLGQIELLAVYPKALEPRRLPAVTLILTTKTRFNGKASLILAAVISSNSCLPHSTL